MGVGVGVELESMGNLLQEAKRLTADNAVSLKKSPLVMSDLSRWFIASLLDYQPVTLIHK